LLIPIGGGNDGLSLLAILFLVAGAATSMGCLSFVAAATAESMRLLLVLEEVAAFTSAFDFAVLLHFDILLFLFLGSVFASFSMAIAFVAATAAKSVSLLGVSKQIASLTSTGRALRSRLFLLLFLLRCIFLGNMLASITVLALALVVTCSTTESMLLLGVLHEAAVFAGAFDKLSGLLGGFAVLVTINVEEFLYAFFLDIEAIFLSESRNGRCLNVLRFQVLLEALVHLTISVFARAVAAA